MNFLARLCLLVLLLPAACASLSPGYDEPSVTLKSFRPMPASSQGSGGGLPGFEIVLTITNPNSETLRIEGVAYDIELGGHKLITGVGNNIAPIEGYSQGEVTLSASPSVYQGVRLIMDLVRAGQGGPQSLDYEFNAKLDMAGFGLTKRISDKGEFSLSELGMTGHR